EAVGRLAVVLRPMLELVVMIEARAARDREDFGDDVEVRRYERRPLPVTTLYILAERGVGIGAQPRMARERVGNGADGGQTVNAVDAGRLGEVEGVALWN